jgi:hypothetical protein
MPDAPRRSLESLRKEAKRWLAALDTDRDAIIRLRRVYPAAPASPTLRDVQHALALEHGVAGWAALKAQCIAAGDAAHASLAQYEAMADALLDAYRLGTPAAMERHWALTWHRRAWAAMRTYVQIDLGRVAGPDVEITRDDARWLVAREHDFADWDDLERTVTTVAQPRDLLTKPMAVLRAPDAGIDDATLRSRHWRQLLTHLADPNQRALHANGQMTDTLARDVAALPHLTALHLDGSTQLTDTGLRAIAQLPNLRQLHGDHG